MHKGRRKKELRLLYFSEEHLKKMAEVIDNTEDLTLMMCGAEFGIRVSEMCGIRIQDLDLKLKQIRIYEKKKNRVRLIRFTDKIAGLIKRYLKGRKIRKGKEDILFPYSWKTLDSRVKKWSKIIGINRWVSWHTLRRTYVVLSKKAGRDVKTVQAQTGDDLRTILEWYSLPTDEDLQKDSEDHPILPDGL